MNTLFRFAGIVILVIGGFAIAPGTARAKVEPSQPTDFLSNRGFKEILVYSDYTPSCKENCEPPTTTQGSGSR